MTLRSVINVLLVLTLMQAFPSAEPTVYTDQDLVAYAIQSESGFFPFSDDRGPKKIDPDRLGVLTDAPSVFVRDVDSGVELSARNVDVERPIASITKLMTALVVLEHPNFSFSDRATVLRSDVREGGRWYIRFGDDVSMEDLFTVMLVASGNNEALALVRELGMTERDFVAAMDEKALALGMRHTQFEDPVGLSANNRSTARDVAILLDEALKHPEIASRMRLSEVEITSATDNTYSIDSTDKLLSSFINRDPFTVVGGKTGLTDEAGACLIVRVERDGHPIDVIVLGASHPEARFTDVKALSSWVFDVYSWE